MAIRRPPTTFSDTISTTDIADDAITGGKLANDIAISTTGNIATTGSGALTVAGNTTLSGTNNLGSNPTITLGSNATFPTKVTDRTDFYYVFKAVQYPSGYGNYFSSYAINQSDVYMSAVVPTGYSSVADAYIWWISGHDGDTTMQIGWSCSSNDQANTTHGQAYTSLSDVDVTNARMHRQSILNVGSTHWEDTIVEGDMLGINWKHLTAANAYHIGISITWRF